jgi:hypothetical protein
VGKPVEALLTPTLHQLLPLLSLADLALLGGVLLLLLLGRLLASHLPSRLVLWERRPRLPHYRQILCIDLN